MENIQALGYKTQALKTIKDIIKASPFTMSELEIYIMSVAPLVDQDIPSHISNSLIRTTYVIRSKEINGQHHHFKVSLNRPDSKVRLTIEVEPLDNDYDVFDNPVGEEIAMAITLKVILTMLHEFQVMWDDMYPDAL